MHAFCSVALDDEKNGKLNCDSNGFVRMIDDISLHSSSGRISHEDAASRRGSYRSWLLHTLVVLLVVFIGSIKTLENLIFCQC